MKKVLMAEMHDYENFFKLGSHHYAEQFLKNEYQVLWLNPMFNFLNKFKDESIYLKRKKYSKLPIEVKKNMFVYSPYTNWIFANKPFLKEKFFYDLSSKSLEKNLKFYLIKLGFDQVDVLWISNPKYYFLKDFTKHKKLIHRCADNLEGWNETFPYFLKLEENLIKNSDNVLITATELMKQKSCLRKEFTYLPNGVDLSNFLRKNYVRPKEFENDNNKKIIYVGAIESWFDVELLEFCAKRLKNISFYIIGKETIDLNKLKKLSNIKLLGKRDYKIVPNYLFYSDVGVIPFKINKIVNSVSPIKLYEYMSVGLNVVSTKFKEIEKIKSPAFLANNKEEFLEMLKKSLNDNITNREEIKKFAIKNSWENRYEILKHVL